MTLRLRPLLVRIPDCLVDEKILGVRSAQNNIAPDATLPTWAWREMNVSRLKPALQVEVGVRSCTWRDRKPPEDYLVPFPEVLPSSNWRNRCVCVHVFC